MKLIVVILAISLFSGCTEQPRSQPIFNQGDYVIAKISGQRGQVIYLNCPRQPRPCTYDVRFAVNQTSTVTHLFNSDSPMTTSPLAIVEYMREYELTMDDIQS